MPRGNRRRALCTGTTMNTAIAASATSPRCSAMLGMISLCSRPRHAVYQTARERNPRRWSRQTRNWTPVTAVTLNPERDSIVRSATSEIQLSSSIGTPATGRPSPLSHSIPSAIRGFRWRHRNVSFPVRSANLLSRPDLATPSPRRAVAGLGPRRADQGSTATRSHAQRREHGEDGEHRTFHAVSTAASSASVGGSPNAETTRRIR